MLKSKNTKKIVIYGLIIIFILIAIVKQKPIKTTEDAIGYALLCLNVAPKYLGIEAMDIDINDIQSFNLSINEKEGFFNQYTNQRDLSVSLLTKNEEEITVRINAYNGECLAVSGK